MANDAGLIRQTREYLQWLDQHLQGGYERAYEILRPVAEAGHSGAMAPLAYLYEHGMGVEKDLERAGTGGDSAPDVSN